MHLSPEFGLTVQFVENDDIEIAGDADAAAIGENGISSPELADLSRGKEFLRARDQVPSIIGSVR